MKLRNKKTGEIGQIGYVATQDGQIIVEDISGSEYPFSVISNYKTLTKLNEDWEDYKPAEPLIKDEKFRKVVRWWAVANDNMPEVQYDKDEDCIYSPYASDETDTSISLSFDNIHVFEKIRT